MTLMTIRLRAFKPGANKPLSGAQNHGIHSQQLLNYGTEKKESREICELALREMKLSDIWEPGFRKMWQITVHLASCVSQEFNPGLWHRRFVTNSWDHWWYSLWVPCLSRFANAFGALKCRTRRLVLAGGSACTKHRWAARASLPPNQHEPTSFNKWQYDAWNQKLVTSVNLVLTCLHFCVWIWTVSQSCGSSEFCSKACRHVWAHTHYLEGLQVKCVLNGCLLFALDPKSWVCGHMWYDLARYGQTDWCVLWKYFVF